MNKIRVVILDNDPAPLELLKIYLGRIKDVTLVDEFDDPLEFLDAAPKLEYDLLISDIEMPGITGLELAKQIQQKVIFITGKANVYGDDILKTSLELENVIRAIPKPVNFEFLTKAIGQAMNDLPKIVRPEILPKEYIRLKIKEGTSLIRISDILAVSTLEYEKQQRNIGGGNKKVYLETSSPIVVTDISLEEIFKQLNSRDFFILSDSCLVQRKAVMGHTKTKAFVRMNVDPKLYEENRGGFPVLISESKRSSFITFLES
jgi:DNA-binding LytR/AlgR family response regulator